MASLGIGLWIFEWVNFFILLVVFITALGILPYDYWWIRFADFPRLQIVFIGSLCWLFMWPFIEYWQLLQYLMMIILSMVLLYQFIMILPYTQFWRLQVKTAKTDSKICPKDRIKMIVANVLTPNQKTQKLIQLVNTYQPDVLLTLESDIKWQKALNQIEPDYPYCVKVPLDNLYGMHLYSKFELIDAQINYLIVEDIPSIQAQVRLPSGKKVWLYCLHPMPPSPTETDKSTTRDAELLMIGRSVRRYKQTAIVAGDLNDVAWSRTTKRFRHISGLLDPRIGRKFINTFHAKLPFFRWALDHVFHSSDFSLVNLERLTSIGSDHFPIFIELQYEPAIAEQQKKCESTLSYDELKKVRHTILVGIFEGKRVSLLKKQKPVKKVLFKKFLINKKKNKTIVAK